jgi:hypothetical protein
MSQGEQEPRTNPEKPPTHVPVELTDEQLNYISGGSREQEVKSAAEDQNKNIS